MKYIAGPQARQAREMTTGGWRRGTYGRGGLRQAQYASSGTGYDHRPTGLSTKIFEEANDAMALLITVAETVRALVLVKVNIHL
ncbi:MAG TPA: hypothetical protein VIX14_02940 [Terriglobales bacterium]